MTKSIGPGLIYLLKSNRILLV